MDLLPTPDLIAFTGFDDSKLQNFRCFDFRGFGLKVQDLGSPGISVWGIRFGFRVYCSGSRLPWHKCLGYRHKYLGYRVWTCLDNVLSKPCKIP